MVSQKLRFDVFKRDSFTCQYCGRSAPEVILEIDHQLHLFKGCENTIENLVTVCRECNIGKADSFNLDTEKFGVKITPTTTKFCEQLLKYDQEFNEVLRNLDPYIDEQGNVPQSVIYKITNLKIKKIKYILEYTLDNIYKLEM